jgi:hypothetical protein
MGSSALSATRRSSTPLRDKVPTIPTMVEQVVLRSLAKDPQQCFESIEAFATSLEQAAQPGEGKPRL